MEYDGQAVGVREQSMEDGDDPGHREKQKQVQTVSILFSDTRYPLAFWADILNLSFQGGILVTCKGSRRWYEVSSKITRSGHDGYFIIGY